MNDKTKPQPVGYITRDLADKLANRVASIGRIYTAPIASDVAVYTEEQVDAMIQAEREACAVLAGEASEALAVTIRARCSDD